MDEYPNEIKYVKIFVTFMFSIPKILKMLKIQWSYSVYFIPSSATFQSPVGGSIWSVWHVFIQSAACSVSGHASFHVDLHSRHIFNSLAPADLCILTKLPGEALRGSRRCTPPDSESNKKWDLRRPSPSSGVYLSCKNEHLQTDRGPFPSRCHHHPPPENMEKQVVRRWAQALLISKDTIWFSLR